MGFMDAFKNLEKLCGEIYGQQNGISAYIDEMTQTPGSYSVKGWNEDLKKLKHYRWVRNQISHEPNCSEANMCEPCDTVWLVDFYHRIMNRSDPLALYRKKRVPQKPAVSQTVQPSRTPAATNSRFDRYASPPSKQRKRSNRVDYLVFLILVFLFALAVLVLSKEHLF